MDKHDSAFARNKHTVRDFGDLDLETIRAYVNALEAFVDAKFSVLAAPESEKKQAIAAMWAAAALVRVDCTSELTIADLAARVRQSVPLALLYEQDCALLVLATRRAMQRLDPIKAEALAVYLRLDLLIEDTRFDRETGLPHRVRELNWEKPSGHT